MAAVLRAFSWSCLWAHRPLAAAVLGCADRSDAHSASLGKADGCRVSARRETLVFDSTGGRPRSDAHDEASAGGAGLGQVPCEGGARAGQAGTLRIRVSGQHDLVQHPGHLLQDSVERADMGEAYVRGQADGATFFLTCFFAARPRGPDQPLLHHRYHQLTVLGEQLAAGQPAGPGRGR